MKDRFDGHIPYVEEKIGYVFRDKSLLIQAFTRTSFCNEQNKSECVRYSSNEVLEFFGDGVLSLAIITVLMSENTERYEYGIKTDLNEGDFSNIKSKLSDKKNLSKSMSELGLQRFLRMGEGDEKLGISEEPSVMEDLFESIVGAIYIDCDKDMKTVIRSVAKMLDTGEYLKKNARAIQSYKNAVQEWCADKQRRLPPPVYKTVSEEGPDHKKVYRRACIIGGEVMGIGEGKNQKIADSAAAEAALWALKEKESVKAPRENQKDAPSTLRSYTSKMRLQSPEFVDLGESDNSDEYAREFVFECRVGEVLAKGIGRSKSEARTASALAMISILKSEKQFVKKSCKKH